MVYVVYFQGMSYPPRPPMGMPPGMMPPQGYGYPIGEYRAARMEWKELGLNIFYLPISK